MRTILQGEEAIKHYRELLETQDYIHPTAPNVVGGYWEEGGYWLAFDNRSNDAYIEEFFEQIEAIKFAIGELAQTRGGTLI